MPDILFTVVIPIYNRADLLTRALESLARSRIAQARAVEVVVVDNNSTDDIESVVASTKDRGFPFALRYVVEPVQGVSKARNTGIAQARGQYVVFMDADQRIDASYLARLEGVFEQTAATCVGGPVTYFNAGELPAWLPPLIERVGQFDGGRETRLLSPAVRLLNGGNMAVEREALVAIGGFDESMGRRGDALFVNADREIQERLYAAGKRIAYSPDLIQYHDLRADRLKKSYWRRNRFDWGRSDYRRGKQSGPPSGGPRLFGAPRWLWRRLAAHELPRYLKSVATAADTNERFHRQLDVCLLLGRIYEARAEHRTSAQRSRPSR